MLLCIKNINIRNGEKFQVPMINILWIKHIITKFGEGITVIFYKFFLYTIYHNNILYLLNNACII